MLQNKQLFFRYIHNFRGIAILLIVLGHTIGFLDAPDKSLLVTTIRVTIFNSSVYFIFIAGFLFQLLSRRYRHQNYLKAKFLNVVLPYLFVSIPAICLCLITNRPFYETIESAAFKSWPVVHKIAHLYATGSHFFHFWFVPVICIFYLCAPIFIWFDCHPRYYNFLPLLICFSIVVPRAQNDAFVLQNFIHFMPVYVLGMFCAHYQAAILLFMKKHWRSALTIVIGLTILEIVSIDTGSFWINVFYLNTISKSILSIVLFYLLWRFDTAIPARVHAIVGRIADLSFGIYFLHAYIIYACMYIVKYSIISAHRNIFFVAALLAIVMAVNIWMLLISRKILHHRSRYLFGC
jgi:surface polysaccharide O-acyltransferase-like enzyme